MKYYKYMVHQGHSADRQNRAAARARNIRDIYIASIEVFRAYGYVLLAGTQWARQHPTTARAGVQVVPQETPSEHQPQRSQQAVP